MAFGFGAEEFILIPQACGTQQFQKSGDFFMGDHFSVTVVATDLTRSPLAACASP
jgi:hypothetical protein